MEFAGSTATVAGWLIAPDAEIKMIAVYLNEQLLDEQPVAIRKDVGQVFAHVAHAERSGFAIVGSFEASGQDFVSVSVVGTAESGELFLLQKYCLTAPYLADDLPDERLRRRVAGDVSEKVFVESGVDNALQFIAFLQTHLPTRARSRVLDWGCGAGRIDRYLLRFWPDISLTGSDIDAEAIAWCNHSLPSGAFHITDLVPPLPFEDGSFDAVIGYSVMTHLPWTLQKQWLSEICRVLVPQGVFAASLHGLFAANLNPAISTALERDEMLDGALDRALDGVAPAGYYRTVYQTPSFTRREWGREGVIVDYVEGGMSALHDLVGFRRRD